jgi:hypothetical protein
MVDDKANKVECENMLDSIDILRKQVQTTVVLFNEALKLNVLRGNDSEQAKNDRSLLLIE